MKIVLPPEAFHAKTVLARVWRHAKYGEVRISRAGGKFPRPTEECASQNVGNTKRFFHRVACSWRALGVLLARFYALAALAFKAHLAPWDSQNQKKTARKFDPGGSA